MDYERSEVCCKAAIGEGSRASPKRCWLLRHKSSSRRKTWAFYRIIRIIDRCWAVSHYFIHFHRVFFLFRRGGETRNEGDFLWVNAVVNGLGPTPPTPPLLHDTLNNADIIPLSHP